jgi:hypothetical protein
MNVLTLFAIGLLSGFVSGTIIGVIVGTIFGISTGYSGNNSLLLAFVGGIIGMFKAGNPLGMYLLAGVVNAPIVYGLIAWIS